MAREEVDQHSKIHADAEYKKLYDWIMLRPGVGHEEMNVAKAIFKLLWTPLLRHVSSIKGFKTARSRAFIQGCGDNHITWQIIRVVTESIIKELLVPYVRLCSERNQEPTVDGYMAWVQGVKKQLPNAVQVCNAPGNILLDEKWCEEKQL